ncbi:hypothetical protein [Nocardia sp. CA-119907]|uniref:hypothetical protein n=1 Tax=Nocardia sp. CA-119907 TaxID=3239973 RepID=UPI003D98A435
MIFLMPKRSNLFQEVMAIVHELINGDEAKVTESKYLPDGFTGQTREVDICIERENPGSDPFIIGIECRDHPGRKQTIEWVEQMFGKHHLLTHKLILISSSGFTRPALAKAEALKIHTITPSVNEGLRDALVGHLKALWAKMFQHVPEALKLILEHPDGSVHEFQTGIGGRVAPDIFNADGELMGTGGDFIRFIIDSVPPGDAVYRDTESGKRHFWIVADLHLLANTTGELIKFYVRESESKELFRIIGAEVSGTLHVQSEEMTLSHSRFGEVAYSYGSASVGGNRIVAVSTQVPNAEPRTTIRVAWGESEPMVAASPRGAQAMDNEGTKKSGEATQ